MKDHHSNMEDTNSNLLMARQLRAINSAHILHIRDLPMFVLQNAILSFSCRGYVADVAGDYRDNKANTPLNNRLAILVKAVNNMGLRNSKRRIRVKVINNMEALPHSKLVPTSRCYRLASRRTIYKAFIRQMTSALTCTPTKPCPK